jgi:hypothetical protein
LFRMKIARSSNGDINSIAQSERQGAGFDQLRFKEFSN